MAEYAIYPFEEMRITQRHDEGNHIPHWKPTPNYSDKPWDEACKDTGRSYFVPQNDYIVETVLGLKTTKVTNSVILRTYNKVIIPYQTEPVYLYLTLTHMAEEDMYKMKAGQIIRKGSKILREGKDGATSYHFHCTANIGDYYGFLKNSNGKWVFAFEKSLLPNEAFYIDKKVTHIYKDSGYKFLEVPTGFLPPKGYFTKGNSGENVRKINDWYANQVKGNFYGNYTEANVKEFQRQNGLEEDGNIGAITLAKMEEQGFEE